MGLIARFARWLLQRTGQPPCARCNVPDAYVAQAQRFVADSEAYYPSGWGEAKRHAVYARMLKAFPTARHQDLGLAIELAVRA